MLKVALAAFLFEMFVATVQGSDGCCPDIQHSLEDLNSKIEDLRAKLGEQFEWSSSPDDVCPHGFTYLPLAKSCYKVVFENHDWTSAAQTCKNLRSGSSLVAISSEAENNVLKTFLSSELSKNVGNTACIASEWSNLGSFFWTSGQRQIENNCKSPFVWKLSSDKQLSIIEFSNWLSDEPSCGNNKEFCMHLWATKNFSWNDIPCNVKICPVCEYTPN